MLKFIDPEHSTFYSTVTKRVNDYFKSNHLSKYANRAMIFKSICFGLLTVSLYSLILTEIFPIYIQLMLVILLGMSLAFIGFNISHDAIHGAFSPRQRVNKIIGLSFNLIGANAYLWSITHNIIHHTYTNIPDHDEDLIIAPGLIRILPEDKKTKIQRYQHIYAFLLYGLASISWVFRKDFVKFFKKKIGEYKTNHPRIEYFNLFFFKALYYTIFIVIPLVVMDIAWWQFVIGFIIMHLSEGFVLGLVFQLAHVVGTTEFPRATPENEIQEAWAIHQMRTTANFAQTNRIVNFFTGGLNFQIEHHLFPKICHIHYPKIAPIVKQTAHEFDLPYHENPTFIAATRAHARHLKMMGNEV